MKLVSVDMGDVSVGIHPILDGDPVVTRSVLPPLGLSIPSPDPRLLELIRVTEWVLMKLPSVVNLGVGQGHLR